MWWKVKIVGDVVLREGRFEEKGLQQIARRPKDKWRGRKISAKLETDPPHPPTGTASGTNLPSQVSLGPPAAKQTTRSHPLFTHFIVGHHPPPTTTLYKSNPLTSYHQFISGPISDQYLDPIHGHEISFSSSLPSQVNVMECGDWVAAQRQPSRRFTRHPVIQVCEPKSLLNTFDRGMG